jgi:hypothetical protein
LNKLGELETTSQLLLPTPVTQYDGRYNDAQSFANTWTTPEASGKDEKAIIVVWA